MDSRARTVKPRAGFAGALGESSFNITGFQAYNLENFVSTLFSRNESYARSRNLKELRDETNCRLIGFSFNCRGGQPQDPFPIAPSREFGAARVGNDAHLKFHEQLQRRPFRPESLSRIRRPISRARTA